ncbi:septum formation initiator family protein [Microbacterium sp. X-17]|uniref:FtsB family cell division protein n=1 Tax=Microbacterium sp. X-17 TaxID=3144404 RepID=UPI0031F5A1AF
MTRRAAPPSGSRAPRRRVDVRQWLGGLRLSGFAVIMLGLVVLGVFVLVPTVGTYLDQRRQIAAAESAIALTQQDVDDLQRESQRWSDPAYITTQARERLYYVRPGEVVYLVDDDLPASAVPQEQAPVSEDVTKTRTDWMTQFVRSLTTTGLSRSISTAPTSPATPAPASPSPAG